MLLVVLSIIISYTYHLNLFLMLYMLTIEVIYEVYGESHPDYSNLRQTKFETNLVHFYNNASRLYILPFGILN